MDISMDIYRTIALFKRKFVEKLLPQKQILWNPFVQYLVKWGKFPKYIMT